MNNRNQSTNYSSLQLHFVFQLFFYALTNYTDHHRATNVLTSTIQRIAAFLFFAVCYMMKAANANKNILYLPTD